MTAWFMPRASIRIQLFKTILIKKWLRPKILNLTCRFSSGNAAFSTQGIQIFQSCAKKCYSIDFNNLHTCHLPKDTSHHILPARHQHLLLQLQEHGIFHPLNSSCRGNPQETLWHLKMNLLISDDMPWQIKTNSNLHPSTAKYRNAFDLAMFKAYK